MDRLENEGVNLAEVVREVGSELTEAIATAQQVVAFTAADLVALFAAGNVVVTKTAEQCVIAAVALQHVVTPATIEEIATRTADHSVVAARTDNPARDILQDRDCSTASPVRVFGAIGEVAAVIPCKWGVRNRPTRAVEVARREHRRAATPSDMIVLNHDHVSRRRKLFAVCADRFTQFAVFVECLEPEAGYDVVNVLVLQERLEPHTLILREFAVRHLVVTQRQADVEAFGIGAKLPDKLA